MFKRTFAAAVVTGAALITGFATAGTATADPQNVATEPGHGHSMTILGNLCVAPWQWNGPIEALTAGHTAGYVACNGNTVGTDGGGHHLSILDNACVAPWQWNGPIEALTVGHTADYVACNDNVVNG
ncbi:hypothetical protein [Actinokineospora xionganensis]|uniref:Secreted protein n=1 Tax=Actinokineospora xionganensis TaxID=2684470 RepID=A0ABR7LCL5_9PSEU|nr:hypothetical protein [Actinokineospora xionganensis]MBC6450124.1 hypothetical protein [Actinokineospora xionganensis]